MKEFLPHSFLLPILLLLLLQEVPAAKLSHSGKEVLVVLSWGGRHHAKAVHASSEAA